MMRKILLSFLFVSSIVLGFPGSFPSDVTATQIETGLFGNGTVGTPSIGFESDNDGTGTGFYRISDNTIGVSTNGGLRTTIGNTATRVHTQTFYWDAGSTIQHQVLRNHNDGSVIYSGGNGASQGGNILMTGGTEASTPDRVAIRHDSTNVINMEGGALGFFNTTPTATKAAHIADSAGDDATAVNAILVILENLGFAATS